MILETGQMTVDERKSFLDVWDMPEEEFQRLKELYEKYGIQGIQQTRIGSIRRQENKVTTKRKNVDIVN